MSPLRGSGQFPPYPSVPPSATRWATLSRPAGLPLSGLTTVGNPNVVLTQTLKPSVYGAGAARLKAVPFQTRFMKPVLRQLGESDDCWLSKSDPFWPSGRTRDTSPFASRSMFIELDSDGIGRRTQRRVISRAWMRRQPERDSEGTCISLPHDCFKVGVPVRRPKVPPG